MSSPPPPPPPPRRPQPSGIDSSPRATKKEEEEEEERVQPPAMDEPPMKKRSSVTPPPPPPLPRTSTTESEAMTWKHSTSSSPSQRKSARGLVPPPPPPLSQKRLSDKSLPIVSNGGEGKQPPPLARPPALLSSMRQNSDKFLQTSAPSPSTPTVMDDEQQRGRVVLELFDTERVYAQLLSEFHTAFLKPLEQGADKQARDFMSRPKLTGVTSNIEQLSHLSEQLLKELAAALKMVDCEPLVNKEKPSIMARKAARAKIGPVFERFASLLEMYEQYCANHSFAQQDVRSFLDRPSFQIFWRSCADALRQKRNEVQQRSMMHVNVEEDGGGGGAGGGNNSTTATHNTSLDGFLILPVQRVPRYVLLLKELTKFTTRLASNGDDEYVEELQSLNRALKDVSEAATRMNEAIRQSEHSKSMAALQAKFVGGSVDLLGGSMLGHRYLVREGELMRVTQKSLRHKPFYFHLLNDMILYSEDLGGPTPRQHTYKLHRALPFDAQTVILTKGYPLPSGTAPYIAYTNAESQVKSGGGFVRRVSSMKMIGLGGGHHHQQQPSSSSITNEKSPTTGIIRKRIAGSSGGEIQHDNSFQIATTLKTITLYAQSKELKMQWIADLRKVLDGVKRIKANEGVAMTPYFNSDGAGTSPDCDVCGMEFSLIRRRVRCRRCGVQSCANCCSRKRIIRKTRPQTCCDVCRLEMDLTAQDELPDRFRMVLHVSSLAGLTPLATRAEDKKDPLSRVYFSLTQRTTKRGVAIRRGPTSVGSEAVFMFPVGATALPDMMDSSTWVLRVHLQSSGEVGTVTFDVRDIICSTKMMVTSRLAASFPVKGPLVDELCESPPLVTLRFELHAPPSLWRAALGTGSSLLQRGFEMELTRLTRGTSDGSQSGATTSPNTPSINKGGSGANVADEEDDNDAVAAVYRSVEDRVLRFENEENPLSNIKQPGPLNAAVMAAYERVFLERPSRWSLACVEHLYADCRRRFCQPTDDGDERVDDRLSQLANRVLLFHHHPITKKILEEARARTTMTSATATTTTATTTSSMDLRSSQIMDAPLDRRSSRTPPSATTPTKKATSLAIPNSISERAAMYFDSFGVSPSSSPTTDMSAISPSPEHRITPTFGTLFPIGGSATEQNGSTTSLLMADDEVVGVAKQNPREIILMDLLRTEKAYVAALNVLDEVFVLPLMQVAQGATAKNVRKSVQYSRGTANTDASVVLDMLSQGSAAVGGGFIAAMKLRKDAKESKAVASYVRQPDVTVMLQSIRQILTVNKQLLADLEERLRTVTYDKCIGEIFSRFAVVLKVYNTYTTKHASVEKALSMKTMGLRRGSSTGSRDSITSNVLSGLLGRSKSPSNNGTNRQHGGGNNKNSSPSSRDVSGKVGSSSHADEEESGEHLALVNFVKVLEADERCEGRTFVQLLRLPKERLNRYKRMLTTLLMHTPPEHADSAPLRESVDALRASESHITWSMRERSNIDKIREIQKSLTHLPQSIHLASAGRWFEKEGFLVKRSRKEDRLYKFWLFNDALVYGEPMDRYAATSTQFRYHRFLMLKDTLVQDCPESVGERKTSATGKKSDRKGDPRFAFQIRSPQKSFIVMIPLILYTPPIQDETVPLDGTTTGTGTTTSTPPAPMLSTTSSSSTNLKSSFRNGTAGNGSPEEAPFNKRRDNDVNHVATDEEKALIKKQWLESFLKCILEVRDGGAKERELGEKIDNTRKSIVTKHSVGDGLKKLTEMSTSAAPVWAHDDTSKVCVLCDKRFTFVNRRHHCRKCGRLVCGDCSKGREIVENISAVVRLRVCTKCVEEMRNSEKQRDDMVRRDSKDGTGSKDRDSSRAGESSGGGGGL